MKKLKYTIFGILIIITLGIVGWWYYAKVYVKPVSVEKNQTANWEIYRNKEYGFTLEIPPGWVNYAIEKEIRPVGSEYVYESGKKSQFPWVIYNIGMKGSNLGSNYFAGQIYGFVTVLVFEASDAKKLNIESEVKKVFYTYKIIPTSTKYFVLYKPICQDCAEGELYTELRKYTEVVMGTFRP